MHDQSRRHSDKRTVRNASRQSTPALLASTTSTQAFQLSTPSQMHRTMVGTRRGRSDSKRATRFSAHTNGHTSGPAKTSTSSPATTLARVAGTRTGVRHKQMTAAATKTAGRNHQRTDLGRLPPLKVKNNDELAPALSSCATSEGCGTSRAGGREGTGIQTRQHDEAGASLIAVHSCDVSKADVSNSRCGGKSTCRVLQETSALRITTLSHCAGPVGTSGASSLLSPTIVTTSIQTPLRTTTPAALAKPMMAFQPPQDVKGRKILEDLQQKKQFLLMKNPPQQPMQVETPMSQNQRTALAHAQQTSPGFFITQESSFGNLILPVLPRFPSGPASTAPSGTNNS
ncbi:SOSS complex subunit C-like [Tropilaelaps mercedesae]|uniref:SOSS complex subunit C-like n=1 Tax=Tropilaelaps mercedesae TaxID=418985 RepID=A0A1V9XZD6_9ACAR|nr:SOSS complex subunit C-like [Tropilaelaps mercedesae]